VCQEQNVARTKRRDADACILSTLPCDETIGTGFAGIVLTIGEADSALRATPRIGLADIDIRAGVHAAEYVHAATVVWVLLAVRSYP
jgi:hypothetical protein